MQRKYKIIILFSLILGLICIFSKVIANTKIIKVDISLKTNLTIEFTPENKVAENIEFQLYKIANLSENSEISLTENFKGYPISFQNPDINEWRKIARNS